MEVIPVINCPDAECIEEKIRIAEGFSEWVHLDVADARFTFGRSGGTPEGWSMRGARVKLEVHLMVEEPEKAVPLWLAAGAKRVIVHLEALIDPVRGKPRRDVGAAAPPYGAERTSNGTSPLHRRGEPVDPIALIRAMKSQCASHGAALMLAISPETPMTTAKPFLKYFSEFQILAVHAGPPGQAFLPLSLEKITFLRREAPHARIEVDGGINLATAAQAKGAGATTVAAGTYIFSSSNPTMGYRKLRNI